MAAASATRRKCRTWCGRGDEHECGARWQSRSPNVGQTKRARAQNLIDLAGSERSVTNADRKKEGGYINKSLLTLGTVIGKLSEGKGYA